MGEGFEDRLKYGKSMAGGVGMVSGWGAGGLRLRIELKYGQNALTLPIIRTFIAGILLQASPLIQLFSNIFVNVASITSLLPPSHYDWSQCTIITLHQVPTCNHIFDYFSPVTNH